MREILKDIQLTSYVVTSLSPEIDRLSADLRKLIPPFVDHPVEYDTSISAVNFNVNNILVEHDLVYGESEKKTFNLSVYIPVSPDRAAEFNEFYLNFIFWNADVNTSFRLLDQYKTPIPNLPSHISQNMSFHFYEDSSGNYTV